MILISIFLCLCMVSAFNYWRTRKQRVLIKNLNGPIAFPLMGSVQKLMLLTPQNFLKRSRQYIAEFGTLSRCWAFDRLLIPTTDYEFALQLLRSDAHINTGYNLLKPWLGNGLLMSDAVDWQSRRKLLMQSFQPEIMENFIMIFEAQAIKLVWNLQTHADGQRSFDVYPMVYEAAMNIMMETALGIKVESKTEFAMEYARLRGVTTGLFQERFLRFHSGNDIIFTVTCPLMKYRQKKLIKVMNNMIIQLIEERHSQVDSIQKSSLENSIYVIPINAENLKSDYHERSLLDDLIQSNCSDVDLKLNYQTICDELNTFMFQGHMITSSALSFALVLIARHPGVQNKLIQEIKNIRQGVDKNSNWSSAQLNQLQYMEQVIIETLRLYPAQPIIGRQLKKEFEYTHTFCGNGTMPIGSEIYINLYEMLRNPDIFEEPDAFKPERQLISDNFGCLNSLSFSLGPRNCIAQRFAMLQLKMMLVHMLSAYEILPFGDEMHLEVKIILRSSNGFQIGLQPRSNN